MSIHNRIKVGAVLRMRSYLLWKAEVVLYGTDECDCAGTDFTATMTITVQR